MVELINKKNQIIECKIEQVPYFISKGFAIHRATPEQRKEINKLKPESKTIEEKKKPTSSKLKD
jgi:hypothetical protein